MKNLSAKPMKLSLTGLAMLSLAMGIFASSLHAQTNEDSPFGIQEFVELETGNFENTLAAGVKWIRVEGTNAMAWDFVEPVRTNPPSYYWDETDAIATALNKAGFNIFWTTKCFNGWDQGVSKPNGMAPLDMQAYEDFIRAAAERYDGDGIDDAPGSPVVNYWQIENEVDGDFWNDSAANYALVLKASYEQIKTANLNAKVAIAGVSNPEAFYAFYRQILDELDKYPERKYFDIMDAHWFKNAGDYKAFPYTSGDRMLVAFMQDMKNEFTSRGYMNMDIWFTETGTYDGSSVLDQFGNPLPEQSEKTHAGELAKRYAHFIGNGARKVFWHNMLEKGNPLNPDGYFSNIGLIHNFVNDGRSHKKLAYYTYKLMEEKLEGSDLDNIQKIQEDGDIYIYKFMNNGKPIWVAWNDTGSSQILTLEVANIDSATVTESIPNAESGLEINEDDYPGFFITSSVPAVNGQVTLTLGEKPVFIEAAMLYGDVSGDGVITAFDAALAAMLAVGIDVTPYLNGYPLASARQAADFNGDSFVDAYDAALIARRAVDDI